MSDDLQKQIEEAQRKALEMQQQMMQQAQNQAFEMQRTMMAAQGMTSKEIEQYLSQSVSQIDAAQQQMMSQNAGAIMDMLGGGEEEKEEFIRQHPQPAQYAKYLTIGAVFMCMRDEPVETLEIMDDDIEEYKEQMEEWWGITDRASAIEMIESVLHGRSYQKVNPTYLTLKAGKRDGVEDDDIANYLVTIESLQEYLELSKEEIAQCPSVYGWDIERAGFLARVCCHIGYITTDEAWSYLERAGKLAKEQFTNWQDYGISIVMGRALTMGYDERYFYILEELLVDEPEYLQSIPISSL